MNEKFFELKKEKQDRIINGILQIFAEKNYSDAATENIIKAAGISKGLLFHYFDTKMGAYTFAYNYTVRYLLLELGSAPWGDDPGPKEVFLAFERRVCTVLKNYPYMQLFLKRVHSENIEEAAPMIAAGRRQLEDLLRGARLYTQFSYSHMGEDIEFTISEDMFWDMAEYLISGRMEKMLRLSRGEKRSGEDRGVSDVSAEMSVTLDTDNLLRWFNIALEKIH